MFKRRDPISFAHTLRQTFWPKMGWIRFLKYYRLRVTRLSSTAESIAANLAGGTAMSLTPFFGIHIFGAMGIAWALGYRMNLIAATVGTFAGNPWTFPIFLYTENQIGHFVLDLFKSDEAIANKTQLTTDVIAQNNDNIAEYFFHHFTDIFIPTAIGGAILLIVCYPILYFIYLNMVRGAQRARRLRMAKKQRALFNKSSKGEGKK